MENNNEIKANVNPKDQKYIDLINAGNVLQAVKEYKDDNNCGLKEAKDYIDKLRGIEPGIEPGTQKNGCLGTVICLLVLSIGIVISFVKAITRFFQNHTSNQNEKN